MPVRESRMPEQEDRMQMNDSRMPGLECKMPRQQDRMTLSEFPIGMGYVPWQRWCQTYPMEQALIRGTIFPELDYPFVMGRCRG